MQTILTLDSGTANMLFAAAVEKGIRKGRREAILDKLEEMAYGLFPSGSNLLSLMLKNNAADAAAVSEPDRLRKIGATALDGRKSAREELRQDGRYYTPAWIIDQILDLLWEDLFPGNEFHPHAVQRICDPAMGCGYFLLRLIEKAHDELKVTRSECRQWVGECFYGVDKDPFAVFMARALLWLALSDGSAEFSPDPARFVCGDSLLGDGFSPSSCSGCKDAEASVDWDAVFPEVAANSGFDFIFGNPPYEVLTNFKTKPNHRLLAEQLRCSGLYHDSLNGQINLCRCFIERSLDLVRPGGLVSMVVPLSLARDASAASLRRRLLMKCQAVDWLLYDEDYAIFPGVTQSACIFLAKKDAGAAAKVRIRVGGDCPEELLIDDLTRFGGEKIAIPALAAREMDILHWFWENAPCVLSDAVSCHVGEVDQTEFRNCMSDTATGCILARGAHMAPFYVDCRPIEGKERFLRLEKFLEMKNSMAEKCRERVSRPRVAQLGIRNMKSRPRLVAAVLPPNVYAGNSLNVFYPVESLPLAYVAGMLNSRILDWLFRVVSSNNNINLQEMRGLPFPAWDNAALVKKVASAYAECSCINAEGTASPKELAGARLKLDKAVAACYGLPDALFSILIDQ